MEINTIDDVLHHLVNEYNKGNLRKDNIDEYVYQLKHIMKINENKPEFIDDMRSIFNTASKLECQSKEPTDIHDVSKDEDSDEDNIIIKK